MAELKEEYGEMGDLGDFGVEPQAEQTQATGAPESLQSPRPLKKVASVQVTEEQGHTITTKEM